MQGCMFGKFYLLMLLNRKHRLERKNLVFLKDGSTVTLYSTVYNSTQHALVGASVSEHYYH